MQPEVDLCKKAKMVYDLQGRVSQVFQFRPVRCDVSSEGTVADANPAFYR